MSGYERGLIAEGIHTLVQGYLLKEKISIQKPKFFIGPVTIDIVAYFKENALDPDNIPAKIFIDGLKGFILHDDTWKDVSSVTTRSRMDKVNPRIEIVVEEDK